METRLDRRELDDLAWRIEAEGVAPHEAALRRLAPLALAAGAPAVVVQVLLDPGQPPVARERAFGRLAAFAAPVRTVRSPAA